MYEGIMYCGNQIVTNTEVPGSSYNFRYQVPQTDLQIILVVLPALTSRGVV